MVSQLPLDVAGVLSIWLEVLLYGIYCSLFFESLYIMIKKRITRTRPAKACRFSFDCLVFFTVSIFMFVLATIHVGLNLYRLLRGYVWLRDTVGPENYFLDLGRWDNILHDLINALITWCADFLVIYRCFIVWNNSFYIIVIPTILLCMSIVANSVALHLFTKVPLGTIFSPTLVHWMNTIYALAFVQNTITTGLIAYKIWDQDRRSTSMGVRSRGRESSLVPIIRIIVESASIYLVELLILIVLYSMGHNGQFVMQEAVVPTVGIVFTLMTVRFAMRSSKILMSTAEPTRDRNSLSFDRHLPPTTMDTILSKDIPPTSESGNETKLEFVIYPRSAASENYSDSHINDPGLGLPLTPKNM
ncbi:hypothetical protein BDQ17DRAFT_1451628 [Cyathus striatus]|nr:hypothetical protein BDQ17DRAFT_1451628 [Cyathus striatus]